MTTQEKVAQMIERFRPYVKTWDNWLDTPREEKEIIKDCKNCALVCVNFMLQDAMDNMEVSKELHPHARGLSMGNFAIAKELENEINNL